MNWNPVLILKSSAGSSNTLHVKRDQFLDPEKIEPEVPAVAVQERPEAPFRRGSARPDGIRSVQLRAPDRDLAQENAKLTFPSYACASRSISVPRAAAIYCPEKNTTLLQRKNRSP